jgi:hypothetical protein
MWNRRFVSVVVFGGVGLVLFVALLMFLVPAYGRYQKRADAKNTVKVSAIQIRNQEQRVKIAKQQAQIRLQRAIGIRRAQDEIQSTLTPLYVQFEMVDALKSIAASGSNNSVVYIPAGANGIPLIATAKGQESVGLPNGGK